MRDTTRFRIMGCESDTCESSEEVNEKRDVRSRRTPKIEYKTCPEVELDCADRKQ